MNLSFQLWELLSRGETLEDLVEKASKGYLRVVCIDNYDIWSRTLIGKYNRISTEDKNALKSTSGADYEKQRRHLARKLNTFIKGLLSTMDLDMTQIELSSVNINIYT